MMKIEYFTEHGKGTVTLNLDELLQKCAESPLL